MRVCERVGERERQLFFGLDGSCTPFLLKYLGGGGV